jgi:protein TonB
VSVPAARDGGPGIADSVLGVVRPTGRPRRSALALGVALAIHLAVLAAALGSRPSAAAWADALAARLHRELGRETVVDPAPAPPIEPPRPPPPPPAQPRAVATARPPGPPAPAQAGRVIARLPGPSEPLDLTGEAFVTGAATTYAGGVTAATGTSTAPVYAEAVDRQAPPAATPSMARPVSLAEDEWSCPWPQAAETAELDEAIALVRVRVRPDGSAAAATLLRDPGTGFGPAAVDCALRARYTPAAGPDGLPVESESPPIRVRFTR